MSVPVIHAQELSRWYGLVMGLNNVSFEIQPGLNGLVGPNGAGKSTLIQIITGQLAPSSGSLRVFGEIPFNNPRVLRRVGFCPERESLPEQLRPRDWLRGLALISGISGGEARRKCSAVLERVGLGKQHWRKRMGQYSKGMRQRVKLAQALMHDPDLLILDEPMNGLDPMGRQDMANILKELASEGKTIIISSHILAELESLCRNILILNWGRVLASGSRQDIRGDMATWSEELQVVCEDPQKLARVLFDAGVLNGFDVDEASGKLDIRVLDPADFFEKWTGLLQASGVKIYEIRSQSQSLEQIFEKVTE